MIRRTAAVFAAAASGGAAVGVLALPPIPEQAALLGAGLGLFSAALATGYRRLAPVLGRVTALAAICAASGLVWLAVAAVSGGCLDGSCEASELGTWMLVGVLLPVGCALITAPPLLLLRGGRRVTDRLRR